LANDGGYVALKLAAEDRGGDTEKGCQNLLYILQLTMVNEIQYCI